MTIVLISVKANGEEESVPRISQQDKARNRQNIVDAASRLFRSRGVDRVGIDDLMKAAGLTHGGFYNHFPSKDALAVEVYGAAFERSLGLLAQESADGPDEDGTVVARVVNGYLSPQHRDDPDGGCPSASLCIDAWRQDDEVQSAYATGVHGYLDGFAGELTREHPDLTPAEIRERSVRLLSELVGAMVLARSIRRVEPELSDEFLETNRRHLAD